MLENQCPEELPIVNAPSAVPKNAVANARSRVVMKLLTSLGDIEQMELRLAITGNDADMKSQCIDKPWFQKVAHLFTENDGKNMPSEVAALISRVAPRPLSREF